MIVAEDLALADEAVREFGREATSSAREVHTAICEHSWVDADPEAVANFIDHLTKNLARFRPMDNDSKSLIATALRHAFAVGVRAGRMDEGQDV